MFCAFLISMAAAGKLIAAIDQGTTSTRVIIFDEHAKAVASHQMEHKQIYPQDGWCEHDPIEVLENTKTCLDAAVANLAQAGRQAEQVVGVGITNQRETTIVWDKHTGKPLHNAIVWLDLRTAELAAQLEAEGGKDRFRATCGLPISTYFSAVKLLWLIRNKPEVAEAIAKGTALFGTVCTAPSKRSRAPRHGWPIGRMWPLAHRFVKGGCWTLHCMPLTRIRCPGASARSTRG